jgi:hypothetical protein
MPVQFSKDCVGLMFRVGVPQFSPSTEAMLGTLALMRCQHSGDAVTQA